VRTDQQSPADYGQTLPSEEEEVIADLMKLVGPEAAISVWQAAAAAERAAGSRGDHEHLRLRIAEQLAARPDVAGVFGRSLAVRINTYIVLSATRISG
jgi:hypothetical protein